MVREVRIADHDDTARRVMTLPGSEWLGLTYFFSETGLSIVKRSRDKSAGADRGSMWLLWIVIIVAISASMWARDRTPWAMVPALRDLRPLWLATFVASLALRWWAIVHLGRFFTVNVAVTADQVVVDDGPYRLIRHPSYTGALAAFLSYTLYVGHWIVILIVMVPIGLAFVRRIRVEEAALSAGLGEPYRAYMRRTKRLVPFVF
jgi:protein-S-isoprenylcysteine O-methyltransferase